jgi:hypothetical protein
MKVYLDATKNVALFRTTNNLFINNILYEIRFIDFLVHFFEINLSKINVSFAIKYLFAFAYVR